nr:hypothetical protein Iba_chr02dCG5270 [Ipomoea batatas]
MLFNYLAVCISGWSYMTTYCTGLLLAEEYEGNIEATGRIIMLNLVKAGGLYVLFWMLVQYELPLGIVVTSTNLCYVIYISLRVLLLIITDNSTTSSWLPWEHSSSSKETVILYPSKFLNARNSLVPVQATHRTLLELQRIFMPNEIILLLKI